MSLALGPGSGGGEGPELQEAKRKSENLALKGGLVVSGYSTAIPHKYGSGLRSLKIQLLICSNKHSPRNTDSGTAIYGSLVSAQIEKRQVKYSLPK